MKTRKVLLPTLTFILTFIIMTIAFAKEGMFPFGTRQIMIIDSWHQYYPILQEFHAKIQAGESLFYSWKSGMGTNFLVMMGYYAMSPLNWLSFFVHADYLREFMLVITIAKIALGGTAFSVYARYLTKKTDMSIVVYGLMYAFSGYFMGYYWGIMWLDGVAILPLVVLGLHLIFDKKQYGLYIFSLAYAIISNFYIAIFICEFIALYTFCVYFIKVKQFSFKHFVKSISLVVAASITSAMIAMITFLPIFMGMQKAYALSSSNPSEFKVYHTLIEILNQLLPFAKPTVLDGLPNIAIGMFGLLMVLFYFVNQGISLREKAIHGIMALFLVISMNINYLNFVWHGLHFPNQVPYRFSFLLSFVLITMAVKSFDQWNTMRLKQASWLVLGLGGYVLMVEQFYRTGIDVYVIYISLALLIIYGIALLTHLHYRYDGKIFLCVIIGLVVIECLLTSNQATAVAGNSSRTGYPDKINNVTMALDYMAEKDSGFYRVELYKRYTANDALLYGYKGITQFSSTAFADLNRFAKKLGMSASVAGNSNRYMPSTPLANGMVNIKYILSKDEAIPLPNAQYELVETFTDVKLLKNKYALPLGYLAPTEIKTLVFNQRSPFEGHTHFYNAFVEGEPLTYYLPIAQPEESYTNMTRTDIDGIRYRYKNQDASKEGLASLTFVNPVKQQVYAYMLNQNKEVKTQVQGKHHEYDPSRGVIMDFGMLEAGETITFTFNVNAQASGYFDLEVVGFDESVFEQAYANVIDQGLIVDSWTGKSLSATLEAKDKGLVYTSIPYDEGWTLWIDGQEHEYTAFQKAFVTFDVEAGNHTIELRYTPPGFKVGILLSLAGILFALMFNKKIFSRLVRKPNNAQAIKTAEDA